MIKRQGDLLIVKVAHIPEDASKHDNRILAEGEITGHLHELDSGEVYEKDAILYFRIPENGSARLLHPEHKAIVFDGGEYKVVRQREYSPNGWRLVMD
jgi:hypothetical protein